MPITDAGDIAYFVLTVAAVLSVKTAASFISACVALVTEILDTR